MAGDTRFLMFGPAAIPVAVHDCAEFITWLSPLLRGWHIAETEGNANTPAITVARKGNTFHLTSTWIDGRETYRDRTNIICAFLAELVTAYGRSDDRLLSLHAGGVVIDDNLILFPASGKTGKSLLTAQCAFRGLRVFSDDVMPMNMETGHVRALGIVPRLRLPVPETISGESRAWIEDATILSNRKYAYINPETAGRQNTLAPLGEERAISTIIRLNRDGGASPGFSPAPRADIMKLLVLQHFGANAPAVAVIDRLARLVKAVPCFTLTYGGGDEALDLLKDVARAA